MITLDASAVIDPGAPVGPDETEESSFLAEQHLTGAPQAARPATNKLDEGNVVLPPMDELIQRIPGATRELMDQLFRAKFVTVKRFPLSVFKSQNKADNH